MRQTCGRWLRQDGTIVVLLDEGPQSDGGEMLEVSGRSIFVRKDLIHPRIDFHAQEALHRMFQQDSAARTDATRIFAAVKAGHLAGIYIVDQSEPAMRARKWNTWWWLVIPKGEDAVLRLAPEALVAGQPLIAFRDQVKSDPARLDRALRKAWASYQLLRGGHLTECRTTSGSGVLAEVSVGTPLSNIMPPVLCQIGAPPHPAPAPGAKPPAPPSPSCVPPPLPKRGPSGRLVDPPDPDFARWFLPTRKVVDCNSKAVVNQTIWADNDVTTFPFARELWVAMRRDIEQASGPKDFVYIAGMDTRLDTDLNIGLGKPILLETVLRQAAERGVKIRGLLGHVGGSAKTAAFINRLPNGGAVVDFVRGGGTNHQKILLVSGQRGLVAYCGGTDIAPDRANWHDVHCRIRGPATQDLHRNFVERWHDQADVAKLPMAAQKLVQLALSSAVAGDKHVQFVRTIGPASRYCFAPKGEHSIYDLIAKAIGLSKTFIYLEDQYLVAATPMKVGPSISELLAAKLQETAFKHLIILIARTEGLNAAGEFSPEAPQGWLRRKNFINELIKADANKVTVCTYKVIDRSAVIDFNNPRHIHSKAWIFDDRFAVFGSANCDRVGYTRSTEADVGIGDENVHGDRLLFAHKLRMDLWLKHLNPDFPAKPVFEPKDIFNPLAALRYWRCPLPQSLIETYDLDAQFKLQPPNLDARDRPGPNPDKVWNAYDPDGS